MALPLNVKMRIKNLETHSLIVLTVHTREAQQAARQVASDIAAFARSHNVFDAHIVITTPAIGVSAFDEAQMREFGWVRAQVPDLNIEQMLEQNHYLRGLLDKPQPVAVATSLADIAEILTPVHPPTPESS